MSQRTKRRRLDYQLETNGDVSVDDICQPASTMDKTTWNGFCEIESEPVGFNFIICHVCFSSRSATLILSKALFNVMLREFGVKGVKVQEVVSLDEELMAFLKYDAPEPNDFLILP